MFIVIIGGHLGADPEVRYPDAAKKEAVQRKVTTFRMGCRARSKNNEDTIWVRCTVWGDSMDNIIRHLKKGTGVIVTGELRKPEIYTDRQGAPQISFEIVVNNISFSPFGRPGQNQATSPSSESTEKEADFNMASIGGAVKGKAADSAAIDPMDEEIPF